MDEATTEVVLQALMKIKKSLDLISERLDRNDRQIATMMQWWTRPLSMPLPETEAELREQARLMGSMLPPGADVP